MVIQLENGLKNWADILQKETGKKTAKIAGTGAAGGISMPLLSFFNAAIVPGADFVLSLLNFDEHVKWADVVITGEGKLDAQTLNNKAPFAVSKWAKKQNKPVFAFGGLVEKEAAIAFDRIFCISKKGTDLEYAIKNARQILYDFTFNLHWINIESLLTEVSKVMSNEKLNRVLELINAEKAKEAQILLTK
ncbi:MAG: glycerate kinase [Draconibacterium sp.]|nr:glycerate kinase [Draconibacterium sp.]